MDYRLMNDRWRVVKETKVIEKEISLTLEIILDAILMIILMMPMILLIVYAMLN